MEKSTLVNVIYNVIEMTSAQMVLDELIQQMKVDELESHMEYLIKVWDLNKKEIGWD